MRKAIDDVGVRDERRFVGDGQAGPPDPEPVQRLEDDARRLGVDVGQRLVEEQHRAIEQERPGQREALPLAARQVDAVLAERRLERAGQAAHERVEGDELERAPDARVLDRPGVEGERLAQRAGEEVQVLGHDRELRSQ